MGIHDTWSQTAGWEPADSFLSAFGVSPLGALLGTDLVWLSVGILSLALLVAGVCHLLWGSRIAQRAESNRRLARNDSDAVFEFDLQSGRLQWTSAGVLEELGFDPGVDFQLGTNDDLVHADDRAVLSESRDRLAHGHAVDIEFRIRDPHDNWSWFHVHATPVQCLEGPCEQAVGVLRCTNDLHRTQEKRAESRRLETIGTIAGGIAHEFNNHLTPIRGYIELTIDDLGPDHPATEGLRTALNRVIHCSELVSQIQAYGRKSLLDLRPADLMDILPGVVRIGMSIDPTRGHAVRVEEAWPERLPRVRLDKSQFQQGVIQLLRNAYEAMPRGGTLRIEARETDVSEDDCKGSRDAVPGAYIRLTVSDTGVGISREHMDQVMDPFFTTHGRAYARGMGLSMVQGMMAQHGGWMEIHSRKGKGASVVLYFPVHTAPETVLVPPIEAPDFIEAPTAKLGRLLIADDELFIRDIVRTIFEGEHWVVDEVVDSHGVISRFENATLPYDVLMLDVCMPGPPIEDAVGRVRAASPDTRILLTSGFARNQRIETLLRHRGVEYIAKPFSTRELLQKVDTLLPAAP